jgi:hypothetical protein
MKIPTKRSLFPVLLMQLLMSTTVTFWATAQVRDMLPLAPGHTWEYALKSSYEACISMYPPCEGGADSGTVIYHVIDSTARNDTLVWRVEVMRNLLRREYSDFNHTDTTYRLCDTTKFSLFEIVAGNHRLVSSSLSDEFNPIWIFPGDPEMATYRFQTADSAGLAVVWVYVLRIHQGVVSKYTYHADSGLVRCYASYRTITSQGFFDAIIRRSVLTSLGSLCRLTTTIPRPDLTQNYPNPFNPSTTIRYGLPNRSHVKLTVFNTLGQQLALLQNGEQEAGYHEVKFDGRNLTSGVYLYRMEAGGYVETKKCVLVK